MGKVNVTPLVTEDHCTDCGQYVEPLGPWILFHDRQGIGVPVLFCGKCFGRQLFEWNASGKMAAHIDQLVRRSSGV